jgi:hypothetical protein
MSNYNTFKEGNLSNVNKKKDDRDIVSGLKGNNIAGGVGYNPPHELYTPLVGSNQQAEGQQQQGIDNKPKETYKEGNLTHAVKRSNMGEDRDIVSGLKGNNIAGGVGYNPPHELYQGSSNTQVGGQNKDMSTKQTTTQQRKL